MLLSHWSRYYKSKQGTRCFFFLYSLVDDVLCFGSTLISTHSATKHYGWCCKMNHYGRNWHATGFLLYINPYVMNNVKTTTTLLKRKIGKIHTCQKVNKMTICIHANSLSLSTRFIMYFSCGWHVDNQCKITVLAYCEYQRESIWCDCKALFNLHVGCKCAIITYTTPATYAEYWNIDKRKGGRCTQRSISDTVAYAICLVCTMERIIGFYSACGKWGESPNKQGFM